MDLRNVRKRAGFTQAELAKEVGVNRATISKYESGQIKPTLEQLEGIAKALGVPLWELVPDKIGDAIKFGFENGYLARLDEFGLPENVEDPQPSFDFYFRELSHQENKIFNELAADYRKMNIDGMKEAARNIKIIAGNPVFQRITSPQTPTEDTPDD